MASLILCHLMNGVVDSVQTQLFCLGRDVFLASAGASLSSYAQLQILLGGVGDNLTQQLCKFCSMLRFLKAAVL